MPGELGDVPRELGTFYLENFKDFWDKELNSPLFSVTNI